jgi:hypothetical protein
LGSKLKKPIKAALLSALVYPGVGHFFLKKYVFGAVFAAIFSVPLYLITREIIVKAKNIVEHIKNGEIPLDISVISASLSTSPVGVDAQELTIKMYVLVIIWFIAIIDSYRLARKI